MTSLWILYVNSAHSAVCCAPLSWRY